MKLPKPPRPTTKAVPRADLLKDGEIVAEEQYSIVTNICQIILSQLIPQHEWTVTQYNVEPHKPPPEPPVKWG